MKRARRIALVVFIAVVESTNAARAQAGAGSTIALEIKGIKLGMPRTEIVSTYPQWVCTTNACGSRGTPTSGFSTIAGVAVDFVSVTFNDKDQVARLHITLSSTGAQAVGMALTEKYGKPKVTEAPYQTRGGAKTQQFTYLWQDKGATLRLVNPASRIDQAALTLFEDAFMVEQAKKLQAEAAKDL